MQEETRKIIDGCKKGDRRAQESLYKNYYRAMVLICLRYTRSDEKAVEILNISFLKVFENIGKYDSSKGSLYTWIHTITIRCCLDHIRSERRVIAVNPITEEAMLLADPEVFARMAVEDILKAVRCLPPATQAVFNLSVVDGHSHKEIAGLLQISENTSRWHLNQARKQLQEDLKNHIDH